MSSSSLIPLNLKSFHYRIICTFIQLIGPNIRLIIFHSHTLQFTIHLFIWVSCVCIFTAAYFRFALFAVASIHGLPFNYIILFHTKYMCHFDFCSILTQWNAKAGTFYIGKRDESEWNKKKNTHTSNPNVAT